MKPLEGNHSIYRRLTVWLFAGAAILLLLTGLALDRIVSQRLQQDYDEVLLAKARALITLTKQEGAEVEFEFADEFKPEFETTENPQYFQLWLLDDEVLGRSKPLKGSDLPRFEERAEKPRFADLILPDGRSGRRVQIDFVPKLDMDHDEDDDVDPAASNPPPIPVSLVLAHSRANLDQLLSTIHLSLLITGLIVMTLIVLLVHHAVKLGLRPLDDIRNQLHSTGCGFA